MRRRRRLTIGCSSGSTPARLLRCGTVTLRRPRPSIVRRRRPGRPPYLGATARRLRRLRPRARAASSPSPFRLTFDHPHVRSQCCAGGSDGSLGLRDGPSARAAGQARVQGQCGSRSVAGVETGDSRPTARLRVGGESSSASSRPRNQAERSSVCFWNWN